MRIFRHEKRQEPYFLKAIHVQDRFVWLSCEYESALTISCVDYCGAVRRRACLFEGGERAARLNIVKSDGPGSRCARR